MPEICEKLIFELEVLSCIRMCLSLAKQLISPLKMFSIWISCLCTFNPSPLLLTWVMTLVKQHTETQRAESHAELPT